MTKKPNGRPWPKGQSGNPKGRPPTGLAIAELARAEVDKHGLVVKLGAMAASGRGDKQLRAMQLLLAYAFGPPSAEIALKHSGLTGGPDLVRLREVLLVALEGFPEARVALAGRLLELETETHERNG
jgi:hypothetical protein